MNHNHPVVRTKLAKRPGQAIIEFALAITVVMLLMAAAVDLGLAYKSYQMLVNATAEATTYLVHNPLINCATHICPAGSPASGADREARERFRFEQGSTLTGIASTLDLDDNGVNDESERSWGWIEERIRIQEADSSQVIPSNHNFNVSGTFSGTSDALCRQRKRLDSNGGPCFIVVSTEMEYRPMVLSTILGESMTIRAQSVKPIVEGE